MTKLTPADEALIADAKAFGIAAHAAIGQEHGLGRPYSCHLDELDEVRERFGIRDKTTRMSVWLHDAPEDCGVAIEEIKARYGARVAEQVDGVTDVPGASRKIRKPLTYPKTKAARGGVLLKLIDRIANFEQCIRSGNHGLRKMYVKEHPALRDALYTPGQHEALWQHLDALMLNSDAPAGEGDFIPSGIYSAGYAASDSKRDRALVKQLLAGEGDELLLLSSKTLYGRVGAYVVERRQTGRGGKAQITVSFRGNEDNAKVEFARMLPSRVDRWFKPLTRKDYGPGEARSTDEAHLTVEELFADSAGYEDEAFDRCLRVIGAGHVRIETSDGSRTDFGDRSRDGIRHGLQRWIRQHPDQVYMLDEGAVEAAGTA